MSDGEGTVAGADDAAADDALLVLTAMLLTPSRFPSVLGDDYVAACDALALEPYEEGYGLILGQDSAGARWTVVVEDTSQVAVAIAAWDCGMEHDLSPDERSMVCALPGWPMDLAVSAPGVPDPHDPDTDGEGPAPLAPPDAEAWGPAQRRLGADEIAAQWSAWREQIDDTLFPLPGTTGEPGSDAEGQVANDAEADADARDGTGADQENDPSSFPRHPGVRRALSEATAYTKTPPPPGRIRSSYASADVRTLRVDGPGWSMVARTDDIALFLLDEEPGTVIPVGRGTSLPGLLTALDGLAAQGL
ncbi:hypothetical protein K7395_00775 [Streptomyces filamentosus]|uniref:Integral membrane protein n=2 Tax=Streptomyces filamentosus TaxID=67294 RepID=A0ABY4UNJ4_STRFL|nr:MULTISPECIES: hypothetical protein [Streptomyces]ESU47898.1 integral membrane protein [Streptomyces sp. HCCB10043]EWS96227.1 integral membrane protein [Streptomyces filamentosus NRRL 11379]MYR83220.1 hypothetical protein [Streptomyces sp. SID5466]USC45354.1 hypothetical protein K7395_00775 [Streptomyces filamentosus]